MQERYAVVFSERGGATRAGALELGDDRLVLSGRGSQGRCDLSVSFTDIREIRVGRLPADRLNGHATVVIEHGGGPALLVAPLGVGLLSEITDLLLALTAERRTGDEELVVVVPLKPDCLARATELLAAGPPLDPAALGFTSHQVHLREGEAVFVFRGPDVSARVGKAVRTPALWRAGLAWQDCIAGRPSVHHSADMLRDSVPAFSWSAIDDPQLSS
jgi:hypothetical protein